VPAQLEALADDWQRLVDSGRASAVGSGFGGKGLDRFDQDREAHKRLQRLEHGDDDDDESTEDMFDEDGERKVNGTKGSQDKAVAEAISKVHQVLQNKGQLRTTVAVEPKVADGPTSKILEINDLAQKARWAVTNRTNIAKILEQTGVSITTKGSFFPPGRTPGHGESKLHLLVEGETAVQVESAMRELRRLLSEGSMEAIVAGRGSQPVGRYNVVG
jgi:ATP-dependent RNA helicase DDX46/PRP5